MGAARLSPELRQAAEAGKSGSPAHRGAPQPARRSTVKQCLLTPWSLERLLGVIKVQEGNEYAFYSLQFWPEAKATPRFGSKFWSKRFHSSREKRQILAGNGDFTFDSILVVLGTFAQTEAGEKYVRGGVIFNHDCPTPLSQGLCHGSQPRCLSQPTN